MSETKKSMIELFPEGTRIRHRSDGEIFTVCGRVSGQPLAIRLAEVTDETEWERIGDAWQHRKTGRVFTRLIEPYGSTVFLVCTAVIWQEHWWEKI